jgi:hypothetical protein
MKTCALSNGPFAPHVYVFAHRSVATVQDRSESTAMQGSFDRKKVDLYEEKVDLYEEKVDLYEEKVDLYAEKVDFLFIFLCGKKVKFDI